MLLVDFILLPASSISLNITVMHSSREKYSAFFNTHGCEDVASRSPAGENMI